MRRKSKLFRKVSLLGLVLFTVVSFTQCKKSEVENLSVAGPSISDELSATNTVSSKVYTLDLTGAVLDAGYAYQIAGSIPGGDSNASPKSSKLRLFENGVELNPAHSQHSDIRTYGKGRFSHWGTTMYFSSSDNTDPRKNGRKYVYTLDGGVPATVTTVSPTTPSVAINVTLGKSDGGFSLRVPIDSTLISDSSAQLTASTVQVYENGVAIGPAHSLHADIRAYGKGRFSHWDGFLYLSSSDNTDPKTNGRRYTYTVGTATTSTAPTAAPAPVPAPSNIAIGWANVDGKTTGGQGGSTVTVTTLSQLISAAASTSPMIINISGTITGTGSVSVQSNKSIIGLAGSKLSGVGLKIYDVNNVIVQNLKIANVLQGTNDNDCIGLKNAKHVWIDHCELSSTLVSDWEYYDGLLDITKASDYVSVSNTIFHDSHKALLIGGGDTSTSDIGHLRVTVYNCYFYNVTERQPRVRFGYVHVFNNYFANGDGNSYAIASQCNATVRTDNNYFENISAPIRTDISGGAGYISGLTTNIFKGCGANNITTSASTWVPTYTYQSAVIPAADVPAMVKANAGQK